MSSKKLKEFVDEIININRNPKNIDVLKMLDEDDKKVVYIVKKKSKFYRVRRIDTDFEDINIEENFKGYSSKGSFVPPKERTFDMRANYKYIPYLYVASNEEVAIKEIGSRKVDLLSVSTIQVKQDLKMFDLRTIKGKYNSNKKVKENFLLGLAELFSKPITSNDVKTEYIPTQFIAEYIKNLNYDGIIYPSSHCNTVDQGYNMVVFNYRKCTPIKSKIKVIIPNKY